MIEEFGIIVSFVSQKIGDMYSRSIQQRENTRCDYNLMNEETIDRIVKDRTDDRDTLPPPSSLPPG